MQYKAGKKAAAYLAKPVLKDVNGKKLSAGSDYSKQYSYVYDADTKLADGRTVSEGNAVKPDDMIAAGTPIRVVVKASGTNYMDDTFAVYRVVNNLIKNGKYSINFDKATQAIRDFAGLILKVQATGDYEYASAFEKEYSTLSPAFKADQMNLHLEHIPVDLTFNFKK